MLSPVWHLSFILLLCNPVRSFQNDTDTYLWGAYRPNLYFGLRPRLPKSLMTGLMWFGTQDFQSISTPRHSCEQSDNLDTYKWTHFDPRRGGTQIIQDSRNNVELTTEFLKFPGGTNGGSWIVRIKGKPLRDDTPLKLSTVFYFGLEGLGSLDLLNDEDENGLAGDVRLAGNSPGLDDYVIRIIDSPENKFDKTGLRYEDFRESIAKTHFLGLRFNPGEIWKAKDPIINNLVQKAQSLIDNYKDQGDSALPDPSYVLRLSNEAYTESNLFAFQKTFHGSFEYSVLFESKSRNMTLSAADSDSEIAKLKHDFDRQFQTSFSTPSHYQSNYTEELDLFSKSLTSSLLGGIGYFHGNSIINRKFAHEWDQNDDELPVAEPNSVPVYTDVRSLLTATPSRSFFPRGFYWDEGFHLLHIGQWDQKLCQQILSDWIGLIDADGWVAREQILGDEARSKVPTEFQAQVPNYANPPTLIMAVASLIRELRGSVDGPSGDELGLGAAVMQTVFSNGEPRQSNTEELNAFLRNAYPALKRHYEWFRRTQRGLIKQYARKARSRTEAYRWRGRTENHVLTSGMDDYPRGQPHVGELHLDLICWMGYFTKTMREIAEFLGQNDDADTFAEISQAISNNIEDLHWSAEDGMYCDASVNDDDESYFVCHEGYLSLFPMMLSLISPDSARLGAILKLLREPRKLWSPFGIRSLSADHIEFGRGENYWKGPIWMPMNYLILSALHNTYAVQPGPHQATAKEIYSELRKNVIDNVFKEYQRTGFVWEQYDALSGEGRRSHPFTGWTSLVTLIISEKY